MKLGWILTIAFAAIASLVGLVGFLFRDTGTRIQHDVAQLGQSAVADVVSASAMRLALQESEVAARQIVAERFRSRVEPNHTSEWSWSDEIDDHVDALRDSLNEFENQISASWEAARAATALAERRGDVDWARRRNAEIEWLVQLERSSAVHRELMDRFIHVARYHPSDHLTEHLENELNPHYRKKMLPLIRAYENDVRARLAEQVRGMDEALSIAYRRNFAVTGIAFAVAIGLGVLIAHSISKPLSLLREAAVRVGQGNLSTRVHVKTLNEIGVLAAAFNQMVADLQASTVSRSYLDNILQSMDDILIVTDGEHRIRTVNRVAVRELGFAEDELIGRPIVDLLGERPSKVEANENPQLSAGEHEFAVKGGAVIPVSCSRSVLQDDRGEVEGVVYVAQNTAERKRAESALIASLREKDVLLKEVHHRVKNNLQVISSLLHLQSKEAEGARAARMFRESQNRIRSMALLHEQLYKSKDLANIDFPEYVQRLVDHLVRSGGAEHRGIHANVNVARTSLTIDRAIACGLIINELVSNALEHAFPNGAGVIGVEFRAEGSRDVLTVRDDGAGLPASCSPTTAKSLGLRLVTALATQLGGELQFEVRDGTEFTIAFDGAGSLVSEIARV